jgi:hypothetical protein
MSSPGVSDRPKEYDEIIRENHRTSESYLAVADKFLVLAERAGSPHHIDFANLMQFAGVFSYDLVCILDDCMRSEDGWRRKLHARHLALTLVENVEDFTDLLGKPLQTILAKTVFDPAPVATILVLKADLHRFQENNDKFLRAIRNAIIAHRDHLAKIQLTWIRGLNPEHVENLGIEMVQWCTRLAKCFGEMIEPFAATLPAPLCNDKAT